METKELVTSTVMTLRDVAVGAFLEAGERAAREAQERRQAEVQRITDRLARALAQTLATTHVLSAEYRVEDAGETSMEVYATVDGLTFIARERSCRVDGHTFNDSQRPQLFLVTECSRCREELRVQINSLEHLGQQLSQPALYLSHSRCPVEDDVS